MGDPLAAESERLVKTELAHRQIRRASVLLCLCAAGFSLAVVLSRQWSFSAPYGQRPYVTLLCLPLGHSGAGPPRPVITRSGDRLTFSGFSDTDTSLATRCSDTTPRGFGVLSVWVWKYDYGRILWREDLFTPAERMKLASEIARVRGEVASAVPSRFRTPSSVPPGWISAYSGGEGTMTLVAWTGVAFDLLCIASLASFIVGVRQLGTGRRILRELNRGTCCCQNCRYSLYGLEGDTCPECGHRLGAADRSAQSGTGTSPGQEPPKR